ncbi:MAG: glycosyl hydrolase [Ferruginibacter sp.]
MKKICFHLFFGLLLASGSTAQTIWPATTQTSKPWTRWWWMGSAVDAANLETNLSRYAAAGLGGVEIVPIYGAKGYESSYISYLSPKWMQMLDSSIDIARRYGMGVDMAVGTGWPIGGPQVSTYDAATKIHIQQYQIKSGEKLNEKMVINDSKQLEVPGVMLQAIVAYGSNGVVTDITSFVDKNNILQWTAPEGSWTLYAAFCAKTLQKVKRAAPGGMGYTFDHFSNDALAHYFKTFDNAYNGSKPGIRSYFNDSYEVFNANWTPSFFDEFEKRRGYNLKLYLREFASEENTDIVRRIKSDYRQTMADLMLENFSLKFSAWAHGKNALTTNQAHGSPGNLLDLYAAVDIAETETFGSTAFDIPGLRRNKEDIRNVDPDPVMSKFASSAANITGHRLISCETFTWLTEHFKTAWSQCKPEVENVFLSGVNHVFFHGSTYSPASAPWPGWLFYASVNFVPSNSMWPHVKGLSDYINRCQSILQSGQPDNEIMLYWPVYDAWSNAKGKDMPLKVHDIDEWLHPTAFYKNVKKLQAQGYNVDFVSDNMIEKSFYRNNELKVTDSGASYRILVIPAATHIPLATLQKIMTLARTGATIIFEALPQDVPGLAGYQGNKTAFDQLLNSIPFKSAAGNYKEAVLEKGKIIVSADILSALQKNGVHEEGLRKTGLEFTRRKSAGDYWYYVVNHSGRDIDTTVALQRNGNFYYLLDPQSGRSGLTTVSKKNDRPHIRLQLKPGEAIFIRTTNTAYSAVGPWKYNERTKNSITLKNKWQVSFTAGGPDLPVPRTISSLTSWTQWSDTTLQNFSGTALYTSYFNLANKNAKQYTLDLGKVCQSARVWINGRDAGYVWSIPFTTDITRYVQKGRNEIKIEVVNLMANRIRYMDRNNIPWRNYNEINFVNIDYKEFNAAGWKVEESGLIGPVRILY